MSVFSVMQFITVFFILLTYLKYFWNIWCHLFNLGIDVPLNFHGVLLALPQASSAQIPQWMLVSDVFCDKTAQGQLLVCCETFDHITRCSLACGVLSRHRLKDIKEPTNSSEPMAEFVLSAAVSNVKRSLTAEICNLLAFQTAIINHITQNVILPFSFFKVNNGQKFTDPLTFVM